MTTTTTVTTIQTHQSAVNLELTLSLFHHRIDGNNNLNGLELININQMVLISSGLFT